MLVVVVIVVVLLFLYDPTNLYYMEADMHGYFIISYIDKIWLPYFISLDNVIIWSPPDIS